MTKDNVISFEEFMRKRGRPLPPAEKDNSLTAALRQELGERKELLDWLAFQTSHNRYRIFLLRLFEVNTGVHRNSGFLVGFTKDGLDNAERGLRGELKKLSRSHVVVNAANKTIRQIGEEVSGFPLRSYSAVFKQLENLLSGSDTVLILKELSRARLRTSKARIVWSLIKVLDDAHYDGNLPKATLILLDFADFLQGAWEQIRPYLTIDAIH